MSRKREQNPNVIYKEWVGQGDLTRIMFMIPIVVLVIVNVILIVSNNAGSNGVLVGVSIGAVLLLGGIYWNFRGIAICVTRDKIEVRYGIFNRIQISSSVIEGYSEDEVTFKRYLGLGIRIGIDGSYCYSTFFGRAVRVNRKDLRSFVVSSRGTDEFLEALEEISKV